MPINTKKFTAAGADHVWYATLDTSGYLQGGTATAPSAGDQDGSPALELIGVKDFPFSPAEPERLVITGNDRPLSQFVFQPASFPQDTLNFGAADLVFNALAQGVKVVDLGGLSMTPLQPADADWPDLILLAGSKAKSRADGSTNLKLWHYLLIPRVQVVPKGRTGFNEHGEGQFSYAMSANPFDVYPWGVALDAATEGTGECVGMDITSPYRLHLHRFTGDGVETDFNLDYTPALEDGDTVQVWVDGTLQTYGSGDDYEVTASTKVLSFSAAPADGAKIVVLYGYTKAA